MEEEFRRKTINLAAIDIGSNAARILIKSAEKTPAGLHMKKLQFLRIPLRLGIDVFGEGMIGETREKMLMRTMKIFRQLLILYNVEDYRICATSAFRDAKNGNKILKAIRRETKLDINIISGDEEARIIRDNYSGTGNLLYMDVGGGSTELSLVSNGELIESRSFNVGTIRLLNESVDEDTWNKMVDDVKALTEELNNIHIVGSGGNINKLYRLVPNRERRKELIHVHQLKSLYDKLSALSVEDRMLQFDLRPSRADVIVPAAKLFLTVSEIVGCDDIVVPNVGLADGLINELASKFFEEYKENR